MKWLPLDRPGKEPKAGSSCLVAGWGQTNKEQNKPSDVLMSANVTVVDRKKCSKVYRPKVVITKGMMCAGSVGTDTCQVRSVQQVSALSNLPQLCSCEPMCVPVPCRGTREGPFCAKGRWSGSLPLVINVVLPLECTLTLLRSITAGSRRPSKHRKWRNELLLVADRFTEAQSFDVGIKVSSLLSL